MLLCVPDIAFLVFYYEAAHTLLPATSICLFAFCNQGTLFTVF